MKISVFELIFYLHTDLLIDPLVSRDILITDSHLITLSQTNRNNDKLPFPGVFCFCSNSEEHAQTDLRII